MKHRSILLVASAVVLLGSLAVAQDPGIQAVIGNVFLQDTTPGTAQIGHANIKGTFRAGQVNVTSVNATIPFIGNNTATSIPGVGASFSSAGPDGIAVRGTATNVSGFGRGVFGESRAANGVGVQGYGMSGTGVEGRAFGSAGIGVNALSNQAGAPALNAQSLASGGIAAKFTGKIDGFNFEGIKVFKLEPSSTGASMRVQGPDQGDFVAFQAFPNRQQVFLERNSFLLAQLLVGDDGVGRVIAQVKNFVQPDPDDVNRDIVYASIEGPEAAAYVRGTSKLVNGRSVVKLPRHFQNVALAKGMTVQLTPLDGECKGLAVVSKSLSSFEVKELWHGAGSYEFDWEVKAVRRGFGDYQVYRPWDEALPQGSNRDASMAGRLESAKKVYGIDYRQRP